MQLGHSNLVWSTDITDVPMPVGFLSLVAIIDGYSRSVLAWALSNTRDTGFGLQALDAALSDQQPCVFNTDQSAQFTSTEFTDRLKAQEILISMDGRGRALDELHRAALAHPQVRGHRSARRPKRPRAPPGLSDYFLFYNHQRPHSALGAKTPAEVHWASLPTPN
jgi:putative transposase